MRGNKGRTIGAVLAAAIFAGLSLVAAAGGDSKRGTTSGTGGGTTGGLQYVQSDDTAGPTGQSLVQAPCGGTRKVVGGGAFSHSGYDDSALNGSGPNGLSPSNVPDDEWLVFIDNHAAFPVGFSAFAICKQGGGLRYVRKVFAHPGGTVRERQVSCPGNREVTGGGVFGFGFFADEQSIQASHPFDDGDRRRKPDDGWRAKLAMADGADQDSEFFTLIAICARPGIYDLDYVKRTKDTVPGEETVLTASCGSGHVTGGGVATKGGFFDKLVNTSAPADIGDGNQIVDDGWVGWVDHFGGAANSAMSVYAICKT